MSQRADGRDELFRRMYADNFDLVLGYVLRRVRHTEDAADVVAETFLVAWRRLSDVPDGDDARLWLYGVARRTLANQRRGESRRTALGERLRHDLAGVAPDPADDVVAEQTLRTAVATLRPDDREVLLLSLWEGLEPREIAVVLQCSAIAVRTRLSRARGRLRGALGNDPPPDGHLPGKHPLLAREEGR
ncbi:MAG TPA: RNA polymerase sigma factor [Mycobacteriales bacterium]|jgi:RNA polymerase sigma-70 factor (ECF subfamily)|nr:RNA polymerase sigma factor [Mycobacteriales bacterium]